MNPIDRIEQLRARVAELDERAERYRLKTLSQDARVAELVAALRLARYWSKECGVIRSMSFQEVCAEIDPILARAESATPAKHPDTEIVDWLEDNTAVLYCAGLYDSSPDAAVEIPGIGVFVGETLRAAIDAARKAPAESAAPLPMREDPRYRGTDFRSALDVDRASQGGGK